MDRTHPDSGQTLKHFPAANMTLRDYFAGQALAGLCADPRITAEAEQIAPVCYAFADAMLAAREVKP